MVNKFKNIVNVVFCLCVVFTTVVVKADTFTSVDVYQTGIKSDIRGSNSCLNFDIEGICIHFYIKCRWYGCSIKTKTVAYIEHRLPDLVVTAFREAGETPYTEVRTVSGTAMKTAVDTLLNQSSSGGSAPLTTSQELKFNEVNIVGSPVSDQVGQTLKLLSFNFLGSNFLCRSNVPALRPYFMSELDALAWRDALLSFHPDGLIPSRREIGPNFLETWGSIHPRIGFVMQKDPAKAAAVAAIRAMDIATKRNQAPHVYNSYPLSGVDEDTNAWQMIEPRQSDDCEAFGATGEWSEGKQTEDGNYAWNYWRDYECCGPEPSHTFYTLTVK